MVPPSASNVIQTNASGRIAADASGRIDADASGRIAADASGRIAAIDGFRALAMLLVLGFHTWEFSGSPDWNVSIGGLSMNLLSFLKTNSRVDFFIILSGFCLFLPLAKSASALARWDLKSYASRRAQRILPAYYASMIYALLLPNALVMLVRALGGHEAKWQEWPSLLNIVAHALFIHTFFTQFWDTINPATWTMALEVQFYITFPLIVWAIARFGMRSLWAIIALSIAYRLAILLIFPNACWTIQFLASVFFLGRWMQFAMGIFCVRFVMQHRQAGKSYSPMVGTLGVLGAIALHWLAANKIVEFPASDSILFGLAFSLLIISVCLSRTPVCKFFENRVMSGIGVMSYSLFLVHQPAVYFLSQLLDRMLHIKEGLPYFFLLYGLGFIITLLVGYPLFYFFERPYLLKQARKRGTAMLAVASLEFPENALG